MDRIIKERLVEKVCEKPGKNAFRQKEKEMKKLDKCEWKNVQ